MTKCYGITIGLAALLSTTLSSQTATTMDKKADPMAKMGTETSLTGCVEGGAASGAFMLTHATAAVAEGAMAKEKKTPTMSTDSKPSDHAGMGDKLNLIGKSVDFSKHVGHKVTVKGLKDGDAFTAKSVKMVSTTCE